MADDILPLSSTFPDATEAEWMASVEKALKGRGIDAITRTTADGLKIRPLYRESDFPASKDPLGTPGEAPYLRGPTAAPDKWLPWDIRQAFTHASPSHTHGEVLRDLERGVSSVELSVDSTGRHGVQAMTMPDYDIALNGVDATIAGVALDPVMTSGTREAAFLAEWARNKADAKLDFNMDPLGALARTGKLAGGLDAAFAEAGALAKVLAAKYPAANLFRIDARAVHEAGGSEALELAALIASAVDTLRRLAPHIGAADVAAKTIFCLALDANYGIGVAKLRAARRLWARIEEALGLTSKPMRLQGYSSARMLTRYDAWTNMLRNTAAAFAGAVGGADILTIRAFNEPLGTPEELGRRIARNTQLIAMEESQLGRVADPTGGAWFTETFANELAEAAWAEFQKIEGEGGYAASLMSGAFQGRVKATRDARAKDIAKRKIPVTGVSEFPLLEEIAAPVADQPHLRSGAELTDEALQALVPDLPPATETDATAEALEPIHLSADFETLRDKAAAAPKPPAIFLATLGPLAEYTARADFARNLFAAGGLAAKEPPVPPKDAAEAAAAFKASGCRIACICGSDARYTDEADAAAKALKEAGAQHVWIAGKHEGDGIDSQVFMGCDVLHNLKLAHAELGL
ncbi:methylmalonyl-CoA mutase family protein [Hyphomonas sp. CY54-11-8]|uniref:methylmalonyl-CoA mutase family protein n=3 Tax=unclassified Hyphomonas TaxID=2630699 RepID=UPI00055807D8|nr:methylmalonyl-CoA mutase family protein [Hyphomonas sp. CY54-11-8]